MVMQIPSPQRGRVLVASSDTNQDQARREVLGWAQSHGYGRPPTERIVTIFGRDTEPREWVLLDRPECPA